MQDVVSIAGLEVKDQFFGAVSEVSDDFNGLPNDGLLGMAFGTIAQSGKPTFFETLINKGMLPAPMFSVHLSRNDESESEMCLGCINNFKKLGTVEWVQILNQVCTSDDCIKHPRNNVRFPDVLVRGDGCCCAKPGSAGRNRYPCSMPTIQPARSSCSRPRRSSIPEQHSFTCQMRSSPRSTPWCVAFLSGLRV